MQERATIEAIFQEFEATGKVIETLPEDDATVRQSPAEEVLKKSLAQLDAEKPRSVGVAHGLGSPTRPSLTKEKSSSPALVGAGTTATAVGSTVSPDSPAPTPLAKRAGLRRVCETHSAKPIADKKTLLRIQSRSHCRNRLSRKPRSRRRSLLILNGCRIVSGAISEGHLKRLCRLTARPLSGWNFREFARLAICYRRIPTDSPYRSENHKSTLQRS